MSTVEFQPYQPLPTKDSKTKFTEDYINYLIKENKRLNNTINKAIEWCDAVINSEFTYDKLPNGEYTDMGYCLDLAKPLSKILKGDEEDVK